MWDWGRSDGGTSHSVCTCTNMYCTIHMCLETFATVALNYDPSDDTLMADDLSITTLMIHVSNILRWRFVPPITGDSYGRSLYRTCTVQYLYRTCTAVLVSSAAAERTHSDTRTQRKCHVNRHRLGNPHHWS